jgi:tripartite-type tricarboxylate transporter receptor subunit TctC
MSGWSRAARRFGTAVLLAVTGLSAAAADYPSQPVKLIVPWPAGGSSDIVLRSLAEAATRHLGQPIIIDNKPGASGTLGPSVMVSTAKPDGYTITQMPISVFRQPFLMKTSYDPLKDFTYIIHLTGYTFGVVVRADAPWRSWDEFVAYAKDNPGKVSYATPGIGTSLHITMSQIAEIRGIDWLHVPYKGSAETGRAVLGGEVTAAADSTGWAPLVEAGQLRLLVTWGAERTKRFPAVPTLQELGYGIVSESPYGLAGPKGMDPAHVRILHDAFARALRDPLVLTTLERFDQQTAYLDSADYAASVKATVAEQKTMIEKLGLKAE